MSEAKSDLEAQFAYELGKLVDDYLMQGVDPNVIWRLLNFAASEELALRQENLEAMADAHADTDDETITDYTDRRGK